MEKQLGLGAALEGDPMQPEIPQDFQPDMMAEQPEGAPEDGLMVEQPEEPTDRPLEGAQEGKTGQASEEMQEVYNKFYALSMMALYDQDFIPEAVKMIQGSGGPEAGIANVATVIGARIILAASEEGENIPPQVVLHAGAEFISELGEFAEKFAGIQPTQEMIENAFLAAADNLKQHLDNAGFQFTFDEGDDDYDAAVEAAGGEDVMQQLRERSKTAMTPPQARRMERSSVMRAAMGGTDQ